MSPERLAALLRREPDQTLDFLPDHAPTEAMAETLAAFANAEGGVLLVGVLENGTVVGLGDPDASERQALEALLALDPPLTGGLALPELLEHDGHSLIAIEVPPRLGQIYRLEGKYLKREEERNVPLDTAGLRDLILDRRDTTFERRVPEGAEPRDLSRSAIEGYLDRLPSYDAAPSAATQQAAALLRRRNVLHPDSGRPTYAGLLLFGRSPQQWLPSAQILIARYRGTEMSDTFLRQEIDGPLPRQILRAEAFLIDNMRRKVTMRGVQRQERLEYPREAIREAIVNAVAHRDYEIRGAETQIFMFADRIEISSPGRLPGHVTVDNILHERFSRNATIVQVLSDLGFVERLGYGMDRIYRLAEEYELPEPVLEESGMGFRVILRGRGDAFEDSAQFVAVAPTEQEAMAPGRWHGLGLNRRQLLALDFIERDGRITNRDYQELAPDVSPETLRRDLADLVERGILLRIGERKATYYILK